MGKNVTGVGRPRASGAAASSQNAREAVLEAAGELFTGAGYAATTTRAIAERAGLRQASLYYHFPSKEDILAALLAATVRPSLEVAGGLSGGDAPAAVRLWALAYADIRLLGGARYNLGALYLLPEIASPNLAPFRAEREQLKAVYRDLVAESGAHPDSVAVRSNLVFGLVESIAIIRRDDPVLDVEAHAVEGADGVLRVAGLPAPDATLRAAARALLPRS
ncbi:TetR/AcrR family transcriptional regulator [Amycolatopsis sp. NPDC059021]|uniref:TetR/AcrR family transcriptional regulator n=1 Tax=Amycolatopsis sp. NPDC059021 TaxID=3346704 RepID=UPI00366C4DA4